jgi:glutathione S-transferase
VLLLLGCGCTAAAQTDAEGKDAAAGDANRAQLVQLLDEAEQQLGKTAYLAGDAYSVADVMFTPVLFRLGMAGKTAQMLKPRPNVSAYYDRCVVLQQLPSCLVAPSC